MGNKELTKGRLEMNEEQQDTLKGLVIKASKHRIAQELEESKWATALGIEPRRISLFTRIKYKIERFIVKLLYKIFGRMIQYWGHLYDYRQ